MTKLESIKKHGVSTQGRKELMRYLKGKDLTLQQAVLARCYDCMSYFADGAADCRTPECPLYPYMPFRTIRQFKKAAVKKSGTNGKEKKEAEKTRKGREGKGKKKKGEGSAGRKAEPLKKRAKKGTEETKKKQEKRGEMHPPAQKAGGSPRKRKASAVSLKLF